MSGYLAKFFFLKENAFFVHIFFFVEFGMLKTSAFLFMFKFSLALFMRRRMLFLCFKCFGIVDGSVETCVCGDGAGPRAGAGNATEK